MDLANLSQDADIDVISIESRDEAVEGVNLAQYPGITIEAFVYYLLVYWQ